jgi:Na+/H+ antiporter NhaD/arsenite permease-like protein
MSPHLIAILVLAAVFLVGTVRSINLGVLALVAAFAVGTWTFAVDTPEVLEGFPANLFVVLVGVTYLFAMAKRNGTVDWLVAASVRLVRGRVAALPWVMFVLSGALVALGALSPAAVAIIAPVGMAFAARYGINPLLMGLMVIHGSAAGNFSPLGVLGIITNGIVDGSDLPSSPLGIFLANAAFNVVLGAVIYLGFGGLRLIREGARCSDDQDDPSPGGGGVGLKTRTTETTGTQRRERTATLLGLAVLAIASIGFDFDLGLTAMTIAAVLALMSPATAKAAIGDISWGVVLLICGIVTYVSLLETAGTVDYIGHGIASVSSPLLAALVLLYVGAVVSAFASTTGILGALIPLAVPLLVAGELGAVALVMALTIASSVVDSSPFSTNGALVVANAPDTREQSVYRGLMIWGFGLVAAAPLITWAIFVLPGW